MLNRQDCHITTVPIQVGRIGKEIVRDVYGSLFTFFTQYDRP